MPAIEPAADAIETIPDDPLVGVLETLKMSARKPRLTPAIVFVAAVLSLPIGMLLGPFGVIPWVFGTLVIFWLITTLIHELGHLAAAWVAGFRIYMFVVGPVAVVRHGSSFRLIGNSSWALSGYVVAIPDDPDNQRGWLAGFFAAGSVANFATAGLALYGYVAFPDTSWLALWKVTFIFLGLLGGTASIIPFRVGAFESDGALIVRLLGIGSQADRMMAIWRLVGLSARGHRPRDWSETAVSDALTPADGMYEDAYASILAYQHYLDAGREDDAAMYIGRAVANLGQVPLLISAGYFAEAAYFYVQRGSSPALARDILRRLDGAYVSELTRLRAQTATLLAEGQVQKAAQTAERAISLASENPGSGIAIAERDLAQRLLTAARARGPRVSLDTIEPELESQEVVTPAG